MLLLAPDMPAPLAITGPASSMWALLAGNPAHVRALGLRGLERRALLNGGLECVLALGRV